MPRPFAGLAGEADWVALRELVAGGDVAAAPGAELVEKYGDRR